LQGGARLLIDRFGAQPVVVGSDYPFAIRESPPGRHLHEVAGLSAARRARIHSGSALEFLGLAGA
jgi:aminocarboxymuconate-semialdehyde decarboxylase